MKKLYRVGFDIGIGSVGWSVLENDPITEEPVKIINLGVRTFSPNEVEKTGESTAKQRREKRGLHRRTRRKSFRMFRAKNLLKQQLNVDADSQLLGLSNQDVYMLRAKALDEKLTNEQLAKVVLNIFKKRGFKSNRKEQTSSKEEGMLLLAINENSKFIKEKGYRTVGEAIFKDERFKTQNCGKQIYSVRNHGGDYKNCFLRDDLKNELNLILLAQQKFNPQITDEFIAKIVNIFEQQRNFDEGPGAPSPYNAKFEIGNCTFMPEEKRAPKASYTFELFTALSKINNLKIDDEPLTNEQKQVLIEAVKEKESLKFEQLRKLLSVPQEKGFNLCKYISQSKNNSEELTVEEIIAQSEKATFVSLKNSYSIRKKLGVASSYQNSEIIDEIALILSVCKSDATIDSYIKDSEILKSLTDEQIVAIKGLNFDKFGSLSIKAMKKIMPYLMAGERYDKACQSAGFNHSSFEHEKMKYLKGKDVEEQMKDITSNVVKRAVNQTLRVLNEIIKKYGSPQFVNIELARDISKNSADRKKQTKYQEQNLEKNEQAKESLKNEFKLENPTAFDVLKRKLYEEQNGKCMYSGKPIDITRLFEPNYVQVDHIIPFSRSMNDSYNNKVLVLCDENQNKGDKTPFEYFGGNAEKWNNFVQRVNLIPNREKRKLLLKEKYGEDEQKEFISRNLNDTRYMSKFLLNMFDKYLEMTPSHNYKKVVSSVNGAVTSYLRKCLGINKIREDGDIHHAIDATVIAIVTQGQIQKIAKFNQLKEKFIYNEKQDVYISKSTGEVLTKQQKEEYEQAGIDTLSKKLPAPYPEFVKELELRSKIKYDNLKFSDSEKMELVQLGYDGEDAEITKPVFVSRMKTVKSTGAIHKETMMSAREYSQTKMLIKSVPVQSLKLDESTPEKTPLKDDKYPNVSIKDYYRPQDDRLLYLKLKNYLVENGKIPENIPIHKPKKDGSDGPVVRTVKKYEKSSSCVITRNGAASNDKMYRVDVFKKDGKYYLCPIYMNDVYAKKLPNKVIAIGKDWIDIDDTFEFQFSLYQNDLIKVKSKKNIVMSKNFNNPKSKKANSIENTEFLGYYCSTNISDATIKLISHDNCYYAGSLGVKTLLSIEKYYVDIMGNVYKAPVEKREGF
jgi:CRISPR-associated endonuclease Csn1